MPTRHDLSLSKVPEVTLGFWIIKIAATTLGETGGDAVTMTLNFGDLVATSAGLGYGGGALVFAAGLCLVAALYFFTAVSHTALFWAAFILTRPLGATVGDFLDKPRADGGLALGRFYASG